MDSKIFSIDIKPNSFAEYISTNVSPGDYPFYSKKNDPTMTGHLIVNQDNFFINFFIFY